jgi:putative aldouronate transport system substrate-binding protein
MKKNVSAVLCLLLCVAFIATACTPSSATVAPSPPATGETSQATPAQQSSEKPSITILALLNSSTDDLNQNPFLKEMAEKANMAITYELAYYDDWDTKKSTILASGGLPDAMAGGGILSNSDILLNTSLFATMKQLIKDNCPDIQRAIDKDSMYAKLVTDLDGEIRSLTDRVPYRPSSYTTLYINKTWLDKLALNMPDTIDQLMDVLRAFRDQDPNGNGQKDEIPMYMGFKDDEAFGIRGMMGAFDCATSCGSSWLALDNGKIVFQPQATNFKDYANWLAQLNSENLMPDEIVTADWDLRMSRICAEPAMVGVTNLWSITYLPASTQVQYVQLPQFSGPKGARYVPYNSANMTYGTTPKFAMSAKNKYPVETMKFIDLFFIPENAAQINYGPIGITLKEENGVLVFQQAPEGMDSEHWTYKNSMNESWPFYLDDDTSVVAIPYTNEEKLASDAINKPNFKPDSVVPPLKFDEQTNEELAPLETNINDCVLTTLAGWFVDGGVDAGWDAYLQKLDDIGLARYIELYQQAYDKQK